MEAVIDNCTIEHNGDVNKGIEYLRNHWNDQYVLDVFRDARTSEYHTGDFRISGVDGTYVLKFIEEHRFFLSWKSY